MNTQAARFDGDAHGRKLGTVTLELLGKSRLRRLISQLPIGIGIRLHTLGNLTGSEPLRES